MKKPEWKLRQAKNAKELMEHADVFPYWQYVTMDDDTVRASHAAFDKKVFPVNHPFWVDHMPPQDRDCRCQIIALTEDDVAEMLREDKKLAPDARRVQTLGTRRGKKISKVLLLRLVLCVVFPPLAVLGKGLSAVLITTLLMFLYWIPGVVAALFFVLRRKR